MKAFLDTPSLLKLYHQENDTETLSSALTEAEIIYLSELAQLEFSSAILKKVRTQEISAELASAVIACLKRIIQNSLGLSWILKSLPKRFRY